MAYPLQPDDSQGINDALNYLLSGPAGLGQNFQGKSAYLPAYLRPSFRQPWSLPYTSTLDPSIYLNIPINDAFPVGGNPSQYVTFTFTTPFTDPPFQYGDFLAVNNVNSPGDPGFYNDGYTVYSCTANDVTVVTSIPYTWPAYVSGGDVGRDYMNVYLSTDFNARVTVQGPTDQVFVSAQLSLFWDYTCTTNTSYDVTVSIIRSRGFPSTSAGSNDYLFGSDEVISGKTYNIPVTVGSGQRSLETVFSTVLDGPNLEFGYYWYILSVQFVMPQLDPPYDVTIGKAITTLCSLTAQVIKQ